jgi:uncharacterized protein YcfL
MSDTATTISAVEAAQTMTLAEYRLWWYEQVGLTPPVDGEQLTVAQTTDERIIRQGYEYQRSANVQR